MLLEISTQVRQHIQRMSNFAVFGNFTGYSKIFYAIHNCMLCSNDFQRYLAGVLFEDGCFVKRSPIRFIGSFHTRNDSYIAAR